MGADGGYDLYKFSELNRPEVLRRIQNWFICSDFKLNASTGQWQITEYGPHVNGRSTPKTVVSIDDWLKKNGFSRVEDISLEFIINRQGCWASIIKAGSLPGLSEDLVRVSYGDNVWDDVQNLNEVIKRGRAWWYDKKPPAFFEDVDCCYPEDYPSLWNFYEETWT